MTSLSKLSKTIWENCTEIQFGNAPRWESNAFLKDWIGSKINLSYKQLSGKGWYWVLSDISYDDLLILKKPSTLPQRGCDFGHVSRNNNEIFGFENLYQRKDNHLVVYNGHEGKNVRLRLRAHYSLNNQKTGALGIKYYSLSQFSWKVRIFSEHHIRLLSEDKQNRVKNLINSKTGRRSIESAWRTNFGWPILSKE